jgi:hypothetical protein
VLLSLGNNDSENAVLHGSLDIILVNANRESEVARELPNAALREPVLDFRLLWLSHGNILVLSFGDLGRCSSILVLDSGLVGVVFDSASCFLGSVNCSMRSTRLVGALDVALDREGLGVDELDLDVLLFDAWKFAVEFVNIGQLADVEFGVEGPHDVIAVVAV